VTLAQVESWLDDDEPVPPGLLDETRERIGAWNELGKRLCDAFVPRAERVLLPGSPRNADCSQAGAFRAGISRQSSRVLKDSTCRRRAVEASRPIARASTKDDREQRRQRVLRLPCGLSTRRR
jgi:hypothetical protein